MSALNECENCPVHNLANLKKLGINMSEYDFVVALAGNPNTGKSTVFNNLTGLRQHTGNWPGKTVTRAEGGFEFNDKKFKIVDLPGTYSLLSTSTDEEVARDFILFGQPDVTVIIVDATRLERNLNLVLQVLEITDRAVVCLNLMDEAKRNNIEIDDRILSRELGVPVVPASARQKDGMNELLKYIHDVANGNYICKPHRITAKNKEMSKAVNRLSAEIAKEYPNLPNARWVAMRLLEGDQKIIDAIKSGDLGNITRRELTEGTEDYKMSV
ncbi:MAG: 50S ribosome-binding GTPase [Melioribacteraceae bacterium]|nr:50S ribosome-binding GTPase [Melioribacteraceae bacterium]MCF8353515.1 50S ribosome-binding GTPase [Melioribacteraceae bacterium]MCF8392644.1 50S ribosome-binding GTPase [Melioribacteraceae bacterium]MCF8418484.1 50S ribosome-binding GTPase [Melioribacteraceae bacterium]